MARISFEASNQMLKQNNSNNGISFFTLKNDGDEAIVRFMHDTTESFEIVTTHQIQTENGRFRNVSCLREDGREPIDNCPFCKANMPIRQRFYIHLVAYTQDENGNIVGQPMIWERSIKYAQNLKGYIDNYGPLSNVMCKIIRHGKPGDMRTTYDIIPNVQTIDSNMYPKMTDAFKDYSVVGNAVLSKTFNELDCYVKTGQFPPKEELNVQAPAQNIPPATFNQQNTFVSQVPQTAQPAFAPTPQPFTPQPMMGNTPNFGNNPYAGNTGAPLNAPVRYYE